MKNTDKWIVITGASSGIGKVTAQYLLEQGYSIVATSRDRDKLERVLDQHKENVKIIDWDLSRIDTIKAYAKTINREVGPVSGLVHCAGMQKIMPVNMIKPDRMYETFNLNTFAAMALVCEFSKKNMYNVGETSFVLISSIAAREGGRGNSLYAASKGAIEGFVSSISCELIEKGIRINALAPGRVETDVIKRFFDNADPMQLQSAKSQYPMGFGKPEDIAYYIEFLISPKSKWVNGRIHIVDGGHLVRHCF